MRTNPFRLLLALCALFCAGLACCHKDPPHGVTLTWEAPPAVPGVSVAGVPDAVHLRAADNGEQIKIIECPSRFRKSEPQLFPQSTFRKIHLEDGCSRTVKTSTLTQLGPSTSPAIVIRITARCFQPGYAFRHQMGEHKAAAVR